jgi:hypothetical protein
MVYANYEYKYSDKQYKIMIFGKQIQCNDKIKANLGDSELEMNDSWYQVMKKFTSVTMNWKTT